MQYNLSVLKAAAGTDFLGRVRRLQVAKMNITSICNLKCEWCRELDGDKLNKGFIPTNVVLKFFEDGKELGLQAVDFTGGGEPTSHKGINEIIHAAQEHGYKTSLVTNGTLLQRVDKELLGKMSWIRVSLNAGRKMYKEVHKVDLYDKVLQNLELISDLTQVKRGVNCVWYMESDEEDMVQLIQDLQDKNLDYFRLANDQLNYSRGIDPVFEERIRSLDSPNLPVRIQGKRNLTVPTVCRSQWFKAVINSDGWIHPCCLVNNPMCRMENILEFWNNPVDNVNTRKCEWCEFGELNNFIEQVETVDTYPDVEFL
jgi:MoaA/NifB/PqqE/SkfB family radical SAM enzyme